MQLNAAIQRNGVLFFAVLAVLVLIGFWPTYFSRPFGLPTLLYHAHAVTMTAWCALLLVQAYLVRTKRWAQHKAIGKLSYVLAPLVVIIGVALMRDIFRRIAFFEPIAFEQFFFFIGAAVRGPAYRRGGVPRHLASARARLREIFRPDRRSGSQSHAEPDRAEHLAARGLPARSKLRVCEPLRSRVAHADPLQHGDRIGSEAHYEIAFKRLMLAVGAYQHSGDVNSFSSKRDYALRAELACVDSGYRAYFRRSVCRRVRGCRARHRTVA